MPVRHVASELVYLLLAISSFILSDEKSDFPSVPNMEYSVVKRHVADSEEFPKVVACVDVPDHKRALSVPQSKN